MEIPVGTRRSPPVLQSQTKILFNLLEAFFYATNSDLAQIYQIDSNDNWIKIQKKGIFDVPETECEELKDWMEFVMDCRQIVVQNSRSTSIFPSMFLHKKMSSALLCPIRDESRFFYVVLLNSLKENHYGQKNLGNSEELIDKSIEQLLKFLQDGENGSITQTEK